MKLIDQILDKNNVREALNKVVANHGAPCIILDSDVSEGRLFGAGFEAVMKNGAEAMKKGFVVSVREFQLYHGAAVPYRR